jgi:hypothetical protein
MIKKRGIYVTIGGVVLIVSAFVITMSVMEGKGLDQNNFSLPDVLEGMFDQVSDKTQIMPGETASFSVDATGTQMLLWGIQILDYQNDHSALVSITNIFGDNFGKYTVDQPAKFETIAIEKSDIYSFNVENTANRPLVIIMMFKKNPQDSDPFADPNSQLSKTLVPLAISGSLFIIGIITIIAGATIIIIDYKKSRSEFV